MPAASSPGHISSFEEPFEDKLIKTSCEMSDDTETANQINSILVSPVMIAFYLMLSFE